MTRTCPPGALDPAERPPRPGARWRKSTYSFANGNCVEAADAGGGVVVRDTRDRDGVTLAFPAGTWKAFAAAVRQPTLAVPRPPCPRGWSRAPRSPNTAGRSSRSAFATPASGGVRGAADASIFRQQIPESRELLRGHVLAEAAGPSGPAASC